MNNVIKYILCITLISYLNGQIGASQVSQESQSASDELKDAPADNTRLKKRKNEEIDKSVPQMDSVACTTPKSEARFCGYCSSPYAKASEDGYHCNCKPSTKITRCGYCSKPDCTKRCAKCKEVYYCSDQCQKKHWSAHKPQCTSIRCEKLTWFMLLS